MQLLFSMESLIYGSAMTDSVLSLFNSMEVLQTFLCLFSKRYIFSFDNFINGGGGGAISQRPACVIFLSFKNWKKKPRYHP